MVPPKRFLAAGKAGTGARTGRSAVSVAARADPRTSRPFCSSREPRRCQTIFHILPTPALQQAVSSCPLLEGDMENWLRCCSRRFFPVARRIAGGDDLAQDILQISWIKVLQSARSCRGGPRACPWVHAVVLNTARDERRREQHRGEVLLPQEQEGQREDPDRGPEAMAQEKELLRLLREMVALLPEAYRQVVDLRVYQGLSSRKTAVQLHISPSDVDTRLNRATRMLQRRLDVRLGHTLRPRRLGGASPAPFAPPAEIC